MALALLAKEWLQPLQGSLLAIVIDHALRPESTAEAALTAARLAALNIPVSRTTLSGLQPGPGLAQRARVARYQALTAGASGFLLKNAPPEQLIGAVRVVAAGDALLAPSITRRVIQQFARLPPPGGADALAGLTERERQVLQLVARGLSNAEIAAELFVSDATVKSHVAHLLAKLRLRDRVQAVVLAYESGLVRPGTK